MKGDNPASTQIGEWADDVKARVTAKILEVLGSQTLSAGTWRLNLDSDSDSDAMIIDAYQTVVDHTSANLSQADYQVQSLGPWQIHLVVGVHVEVTKR